MSTKTDEFPQKFDLDAIHSHRKTIFYLNSDASSEQVSLVNKEANSRNSKFAKTTSKVQQFSLLNHNSRFKHTTRKCKINQLYKISTKLTARKIKEKKIGCSDCELVIHKQPDNLVLI